MTSNQAAYADYTNLVGPGLVLWFPNARARDSFVAAWPDNAKPRDAGPDGAGRWKEAPRYGSTGACASLCANNGMIWEQTP